MEGYSWRWGLPSAGVLDIQVRADLRRQGLARFLLTHVLRKLQDDYFGIVEVQASDTDEAALGLFGALGFERVDAGRVYRKDAPSHG
jgi:ribosomal protein S18 acetylase RimI-like enzyme